LSTIQQQQRALNPSEDYYSGPPGPDFTASDPSAIDFDYPLPSVSATEALEDKFSTPSSSLRSDSDDGGLSFGSDSDRSFSQSSGFSSPVQSDKSEGAAAEAEPSRAVKETAILKNLIADYRQEFILKGLQTAVAKASEKADKSRQAVQKIEDKIDEN